jgi:tetratricopeptide (TPR) repeat protein
MKRSRAPLPCLLAAFAMLASFIEPPPAAAEPAPASAIYRQAVIDYRLGRFASAVAGFEQAYALDPDPMLLFNVAQARRHLAEQNGDAAEVDRAAVCYERYLAAAPKGAKAPDARRHLAGLRRLQAGRASSGPPPAPPQPLATPRPPPAPQPPPAPRPSPAPRPPPAPPRSEADLRHQARPVASDRRLRISVGAGPGWAAFGRHDLPTTSMPAATLSGSYAVWRPGGVQLELGLLLAEARLGYQLADERERAAHFPSVLVETGMALAGPAGFELIGRVAAGVTWWAGLEPQNPFTLDGAAASGAVPLPSLRLGAGVGRPVGRQLHVALLPALLVARPSGGLAAALAHVHLWSVVVELSYRL